MTRSHSQGTGAVPGPPASRAVLLVSCPDQKGLVARLSEFIYRHGGNIVHADHHTDRAAGVFLTRLEWELAGFDLAPEEIAPTFAPMARQIGADWQLAFSSSRARVAVWVTRQDHCLLDLLWRRQAGELAAEIPLVVSNHPDLASLAAQFGVEYRWRPVSREGKAEAEEQQLAWLREHDIDLIVLAKYMQILTPAFVAQAPVTINIHHSFLPAFPGARPYERAHERGVKVIGATAHYVTGDLDEGPIIEQEVVRVSHRDEVEDLVRKGRDLERVVLARAVRYHLEHRVLVYGNRTVVFA